MTIQVVSASDPVVAAKADAASDAKETKSAPVADKAAEQKEASESDAEATEAKEDESDESDDAESKDADNADDSATDKPKKKSGSQRRKERAERAEAEVTRLQRLVEEMALKGAGDSKPGKVESQKSAEGKPNPDNFETHAEYVEAVSDWKYSQRRSEETAEQNKAKLIDEQKAAIAEHYKRETSFAEKTADYKEVVTEFLEGKPKTSPTFEQLLVSSDIGPAILYELAKNPEEFDRINSLPHTACAREFGKLEYRLTPDASDDKKPEPKKITKAPAPISPVGSKGGKSEKSLNDPNLTQREWERIRHEQIKARNAS